MLKHFRFRTRTLLMLIAVVAIAGGAARWWHDARIADCERQDRITEELKGRGITVRWTYAGPGAPIEPDAMELLDRRLFWRPTLMLCDDAGAESLSECAALLDQLDVQSLILLGRQIVPHARAAHAGQSDALIDALRRHPTLRDVSVDASIRGTPLEFDAPVYTRDDCAMLEALLPNLQIIWSDVN